MKSSEIRLQPGIWTSWMIRQLTAYAAALGSSAALAQADPTFAFREAAGPHGVGLKVIEQYDTSRTYGFSTDELGKFDHGERARPLQTLIWYPAERTAAKPMTVGDYLNLLKSETDFKNPVFPARGRDLIEGLRPALSTPLWAVRDARQAAGRFPVAIYAPSHSNVSWENADLCEYLASHGYLVLATPSFGVSSRPMTSDLEGARAQAQDVSFLIGYAQTLSNADVSRIAAGGFSWGGLATLLAAAQDDRIDALFALDGSQRYYPALAKQGGVRPDEMTLPLLYFAQGDSSLEQWARYASNAQFDSPSVLNAWTHGDLAMVRMLGMLHAQYSSMFLRNEEFRQYFLDQQLADYGLEEVFEGYAWTVRYTLRFLDAYLKGDAAAKGYLARSPTENGVPKHFMAVTHRPASGPPATFERLRQEVGRRGFDRAGKILAEFQKQTPEFKLDSGVLGPWAEHLLDDKQWAEAIALLKLNVELNPASSDAHSSLGRAYQQSGNKSAAIDSYRRALKIDPESAFAKGRLKALQD